MLDMAQEASQAMAAGLERVRQAGEQQQRALLDKVTGRRDLHHQQLSTRLNICASRQVWSGAGTVTYQVNTIISDYSDHMVQGYLHSAAEVWVGGARLGAEQVLNTDRGVFRVPDGAAGQYLVTATIRVDTKAG